MDALRDEHPKDARYDEESRCLVVTVYMFGKQLPADQIEDYQARGRAAAGIQVVIVVTDDKPMDLETGP